MSNFFGEIYCLFETFFGQYLAEHLWGYDCATQSYVLQNIFNSIGLINLVITLLIVFIYYYAINHPRFSTWKSWLLVMIVASVIQLFIGYGWTVNVYLNGMIGDCLMYIRDESGKITNKLINTTDCWGFGIVNMLISIVFFVFFSLILKWRSGHAKYSPF